VARPERNKGSGFLVHLTAGVGNPSGDLAKRFGIHQCLGLGVDYILKNNFSFGVQSNLLFGTKVKEDPLAILRTPDGDIVGSDQTLVNVGLRERGFYIGGHIAYLLSIKHKRSGILVQVGAGQFTHRIRLQDNSQNFAQLDGAYYKGYDRLAGGLAFSQFIGYQHLARFRGLNWFAGIEAIESNAKPLRSFDFSTMQAATGTRKDRVFGIKLGITLPFVFEERPDQIYY
jgi:hypothetical protein